MAKIDETFILEPPVVLTPIKRTAKVQLPIISNRPKSTPEIGQRNVNVHQLLPPRIAFGPSSPTSIAPQPLSSRTSISASNSPEKSANTDDPNKPRISYALYERYRIEKKECDEKYQEMKARAEELDASLSVAKAECEKLSATIKTEVIVNSYSINSLE